MLDLRGARPGYVGARGAFAHRSALAHGAHYRVMFSPEVAGEGADQVAEAARAAFAGLVEAARAVVPTLPESELLRREGLAWSAAHGAVTLGLNGLVQELVPAMQAQVLAESVGAACVAIVVSP